MMRQRESSQMPLLGSGAHVSGSNYNPAVSFALALRGALPWIHFPVYVVAQLAGSLAAGGVGLLIHSKVIKMENEKEGGGRMNKVISYRLVLNRPCHPSTYEHCAHINRCWGIHR